MPEGLSPSEVGKEIAEHRAHTEEAEEHDDGEDRGTERTLTIIEAILLATVAVLAAYSGFASAKWGTEFFPPPGQVIGRPEPGHTGRAPGAGDQDFDASTFNAWFTAYVAGNQSDIQVAENRFRPRVRRGLHGLAGHRPLQQSQRPQGSDVHARIRAARAGPDHGAR